MVLHTLLLQKYDTRPVMLFSLHKKCKKYIFHVLSVVHMTFYGSSQVYDISQGQGRAVLRLYTSSDTDISE